VALRDLPFGRGTSAIENLKINENNSKTHCTCELSEEYEMKEKNIYPYSLAAGRGWML